MRTKTLVTAFDDARTAEHVVHALHDAGIPRDDLGWIAKTSTGQTIAQGRASAAPAAAIEGSSIGAALGGLAGLLIGFSAIAIPGIGALVVAGPLVAAVAGGVVGAAAGGLVDALVHLGVPREEASRHIEGLARGGAVVTVTIDDEEEEELALSILHAHA
jgi:hypothetical protein